MIKNIWFCAVSKEHKNKHEQIITPQFNGADFIQFEIQKKSRVELFEESDILVKLAKLVKLFDITLGNKAFNKQG